MTQSGGGGPAQRDKKILFLQQYVPIFNPYFKALLLLQCLLQLQVWFLRNENNSFQILPWFYTLNPSFAECAMTWPKVTHWGTGLFCCLCFLCRIKDQNTTFLPLHAALYVIMTFKLVWLVHKALTSTKERRNAWQLSWRRKKRSEMEKNSPCSHSFREKTRESHCLQQKLHETLKFRILRAHLVSLSTLYTWDQFQHWSTPTGIEGMSWLMAKGLEARMTTKRTIPG